MMHPCCFGLLGCVVMNRCCGVSRMVSRLLCVLRVWMRCRVVCWVSGCCLCFALRENLLVLGCVLGGDVMVCHVQKVMNPFLCAMARC